MAILLLLGILSLVNSATVEWWLTTGNKSQLMAPQMNLTPRSSSSSASILINQNSRLQEIDGFGWALTGGSASVIYSLSPTDRANLLQELFNSTGLGVSVLRLSIGASDLDPSVFTYDNMAKGQSDPGMTQFALGPDLLAVIPLLKEIFFYKPDLKLICAPWTAPLWMKESYTPYGAKLKVEWMATYATYFVKYIETMRSFGIPIWAITPQNEPLNPNNNPSLYMEASQQLDFIKNYLGPAFKNSGITTKIIIYDHNLDRTDYPMTILGDPGAAQYVTGSAFHLYAGSISALQEVHNRFPDKGLYLTEWWLAAPESDSQFSTNLLSNFRRIITDGAANWCRMGLSWNLASDQNWQPHTDGGCSQCLGALIIDSNTKAITRTSGYYSIGHASKFVPPKSIVLQATCPTNFNCAVYMRPDGNAVVLVRNSQSNDQRMVIGWGGNIIDPVLPAYSISSFVWQL
jgi:glucosylceramidase